MECKILQLRKDLLNVGIKTSISNYAYFGGKDQPMISNVENNDWNSIVYNCFGTNTYDVCYGILPNPMVKSFNTIEEVIKFLKNENQ